MMIDPVIKFVRSMLLRVISVMTIRSIVHARKNEDGILEANKLNGDECNYVPFIY